jgi:pimeloyl-ACP methyl ester carboxylesterase
MTLTSVRHLLCITSLVCCFFISGCAVTPKIPLEALNYPAQATGRSDNLLVLLRGLGGSNAVFEEEGIIAEIRSRRLPFDLVAPDTHFGYYTNKTLATRLQTDIVVPARRKGYKQIWIAGFSMGGLGSLIYLHSYHRDIDGVLLISPYLGVNSLIQEIKDAGGITAWKHVTTSTDISDWTRLTWSCIREFSEAPQHYPPIYLSYGSEDWVARDGPALLATVLPKNRVFHVPGDHNIKTFRILFSRQLEMLQKKFPPTPAPAIKNKGGNP